MNSGARLLWLALGLLLLLAGSGYTVELNQETLLSELASIEQLLSLSVANSQRLETRLIERSKQVKSLQRRLSEHEQTNSEQSIELEALRNELEIALREQSVLRNELENWQGRSEHWRTLAARLRQELQATSALHANSVMTSVELSSDFELYKTASEAKVLALQIEVWVTRGVAAGLVALAVYLSIR